MASEALQPQIGHFKKKMEKAQKRPFHPALEQNLFLLRKRFHVNKLLLLPPFDV